jgi:hypothetical protein
MDGNAIAVILEYEGMVREGKIRTFCICLRSTGLLMLPDGSGELEKQVPLPQELRNRLRSFFNGVEAIPYRSLDYTVLKSIINADACINRIRKLG